MDNFKIIVTARLKDNPVARFLDELGTQIRYLTLKQGEFIISPTVGIRYLERDQFINLIKSRAIYRDVLELKNEYDHPVIIVEGEKILHEPGLDSITIQGAMLYISVVNRIPVLISHNSIETAQMLFMLSGQIGVVPEDMMKDKSSENKPGQKDSTPAISPLALVQMIPEVGSNVAENLLRRFKSLSALFSASISDLKKVEGVGPKRALKIHKFFNGRKAA